jgi:hypothetical protein
MPKRNSLREVRVLDKSRNDYPFATCEDWEAWEYLGDGDENDDEEKWELVDDGTLEDCMYAVGNLISLELDDEMRDDIRRLGAEYDDEPQKFIEELERRHQQRREDIKKQCWKTGRAEGGGWRITYYLIEGSLASKPDSTPQRKQKKDARGFKE